MLKEFRDFIVTGNVIEFAVAVIMAGAIGAVINGFVADIIMPIIGHFSGGLDFSQIAITLDPQVGVEGEEGFKPANVIRIGQWINTIISLITVGFVMFMIVKAYNKVSKKEEEVAGPTQEELLAEIRDLLAKK